MLRGLSSSNHMDTVQSGYMTRKNTTIHKRTHARTHTHTHTYTHKHTHAQRTPARTHACRYREFEALHTSLQQCAGPAGGQYRALSIAPPPKQLRALLQPHDTQLIAQRVAGLHTYLTALTRCAATRPSPALCPRTHAHARTCTRTRMHAQLPGGCSRRGGGGLPGLPTRTCSHKHTHTHTRTHAQLPGLCSQ